MGRKCVVRNQRNRRTRDILPRGRRLQSRAVVRSYSHYARRTNALMPTALPPLPPPDDAEVLCAGTLIRLRDLGWDVHIATATPGDAGSMTMDRYQAAATRTAENAR